MLREGGARQDSIDSSTRGGVYSGARTGQRALENNGTRRFSFVNFTKGKGLGRCKIYKTSGPER